MKYAHHDGQPLAKILGFYDDQVHTEIPQPATKLTKAEWQDCIDNPCLRRIDTDTDAVVVYTPPPPTLDDLKATKKAWIESERDRHLVDPTATVLVNGSTFQMDPRSHAELNDALTTFTALGGVPAGYEWRDADNTNHPADLALLAAIAAARAEQKKSIWETSWSLKAAVDAATTEAELDAITW